MVYLHLLLATALAMLLAQASPLYWMLTFAALYPLFRLGGLVNGACRLYAMRIEAGTTFICWFTYQVFSASMNVAKMVLSPHRQPESAVVRVPLQTRDKRLVTLIGCLLTLTPGTLALDYWSRTGEMFVHILDTRSIESATGSIAEIERRLMRWIQPLGGGR